MVYLLNPLNSRSTPRPKLSLVHWTSPLLPTTWQGRERLDPRLTVRSEGWAENDWEERRGEGRERREAVSRRRVMSVLRRRREDRVTHH